MIPNAGASRDWERKFVLSTLDAISANLAVLDAQGRIIAVNAAWRAFARRNGAGGSDAFVGVSYLDVCEKALASDEDRSVARVLTGLREVLAGTRTSHQVEYPCHSPDAQRWFIARLTRYEVDGTPFVLVSHESITDRKLAEIEVAAAKRAVERANSDLRHALEREQALARTDALTGLCNRRHFVELAGSELRASLRYPRPFALSLIDIDYFKNVNDRLGHQAGDAVLRGLADVIRAHVRETDLVARFGGEEFVMLFRNTDLQSARQSMLRLSERVRRTDLDSPSGPVRITLSVGVAELRHGQDLDAVIRAADRALYAAKADGRDRVVAQEGSFSLAS